MKLLIDSNTIACIHERFPYERAQNLEVNFSTELKLLFSLLQAMHFPWVGAYTKFPRFAIHVECYHRRIALSEYRFFPILTRNVPNNEGNHILSYGHRSINIELLHSPIRNYRIPNQPRPHEISKLTSAKLHEESPKAMDFKAKETGQFSTSKKWCLPRVQAIRENTKKHHRHNQANCINS